MATLSNSSQRPKYHYSQSFRLQATQDAIAEVAPSARPTSNEKPSTSASSVLSKLEGLNLDGSTTEPSHLSEENLQHRLNASGSVQAVVVDDDVLFAGLQGGDIVVGFAVELEQVHSANFGGLVT